MVNLKKKKKEQLFECEICKELHSINELEFVDGLTVCKNCIDDTYICEICGERTFNVVNVNGYELCSYCYESETDICRECGERHLIDDMEFDDYNLNYVCYDCI